jgi:hypothetical protein
MIDAVVDRRELKTTLATALGLLMPARVETREPEPLPEPAAR